MLNAGKHLYHAAMFTNPTARERYFPAFSMTFLCKAVSWLLLAPPGCKPPHSL